MRKGTPKDRVPISDLRVVTHEADDGSPIDSCRICDAMLGYKEHGIWKADPHLDSCPIPLLKMLDNSSEENIDRVQQFLDAVTVPASFLWELTNYARNLELTVVELDRDNDKLNDDLWEMSKEL